MHFFLQNRYNQENNKYQTLPGKFSRPEQNGVRLPSSSPLQLSPDESEDSEFNLSKQSSHSTQNSLSHGLCLKTNLIDQACICIGRIPSYTACIFQLLTHP